jgi:hypothetical protein
MSSIFSTRLFRASALVLAGALLAALYPAPADAIPAFARKHNLTCTACHTKPPRLNDFGEAFHMAGFRIPAIREGERLRKRQVGHVWTETDLLNIAAARARGSLVEHAGGGDRDDTDLGYPQRVELYLAGTMTDDLSYFLTFGGDEDHFGIGHEFFVMANLEGLWRGDEAHGGNHRVQGGGPMIMGPMLMAGKIDPSTNFSYPTNRQLIADQPGRESANRILRFSLSPYAFGAKFFGIGSGAAQDGEAHDLDVTTPVLYNTGGDVGLDLHMMIGRFLLQAGVMQGVEVGTRDISSGKDPYLMARVNFGGQRYLSGSVSALAQRGYETARIGDELIDWLRYGVAANLRYRHFDIYGALIHDRIRDLPDGIAAFDDRASGLSVQADWLATDAWLLSLRYDRMDAGGFLDQKADGRVVSLQGRYFLRDNLSFYLRDSVNTGTVSDNPLQNFRHRIAAGIDFAF